jgi:hypothetical protein
MLEKLIGIFYTIQCFFCQKPVFFTETIQKDFTYITAPREALVGVALLGHSFPSFIYDVQTHARLSPLTAHLLPSRV